MKVCERCGIEISTKDGENLCWTCDVVVGSAKKENVAKARRQRKERDQALRDIGMVKVRGAMGGTYWE